MCKSTIRLKCRQHRSNISFEIWSKWHHIPPLPPLLFTGFVYIFNDTKFPPTACAPIAQNITARETLQYYYIDMCVIRKWTIFSNYSTTHKHIGEKLFPMALKKLAKKSSYLPFSTYLSSFRYLKNLSI